MTDYPGTIEDMCTDAETNIDESNIHLQDLNDYESVHIHN